MPSAIRARQCLRSQEVDIDPRSVAPCKCLPPDVFASKLIHRSNHKPALLTKTITKNSRGPRKSRSCAKVEPNFENGLAVTDKETLLIRKTLPIQRAAVYASVRTCTCVCVVTCTYVYARMRTCTNACVRVRRCVNVRVLTCTYLCVRVRTCTHAYVRPSACAHVRIRVRTRTCACARVRT